MLRPPVRKESASGWPTPGRRRAVLWHTAGAAASGGVASMTPASRGEEPPPPPRGRHPAVAVTLARRRGRDAGGGAGTRFPAEGMGSMEATERSRIAELLRSRDGPRRHAPAHQPRRRHLRRSWPAVSCRNQCSNTATKWRRLLRAAMARPRRAPPGAVARWRRVASPTHHPSPLPQPAPDERCRNKRRCGGLPTASCGAGGPWRAARRLRGGGGRCKARRPPQQSDPLRGQRGGGGGGGGRRGSCAHSTSR